MLSVLLSLLRPKISTVFCLARPMTEIFKPKTLNQSLMTARIGCLLLRRPMESLSYESDTPQWLNNVHIEINAIEWHVLWKTIISIKPIHSKSVHLHPHSNPNFLMSRHRYKSANHRRPSLDMVSVFSWRDACG